MCKNVKSQKNYRILLYTITEKQRREVASGVNVDPTVIGGLSSVVLALLAWLLCDPRTNNNCNYNAVFAKLRFVVIFQFLFRTKCCC